MLFIRHSYKRYIYIPNLLILVLIFSSCSSPSSPPLIEIAPPTDPLGSITSTPTEEKYTPTKSIIETEIPTPSSSPPTSASPDNLIPTASIDPSLTLLVEFINQTEFEVYVFIDQELLLTAPASGRETYTGIQPGTHTIRYCLVKSNLDCDPPQTLLFEQDTQLVIPTRLSSETQEASSDIPSTSTPTPKPDYRFYYPITVTNLYPWTMHVYMEDRYVMSVGAKSYLTYRSIQSGTYMFYHCKNSDVKEKNLPLCLCKRQITITGPTEWTISP